MEINVSHFGGAALVAVAAPCICPWKKYGFIFSLEDTFLDKLQRFVFLLKNSRKSYFTNQDICNDDRIVLVENDGILNKYSDIYETCKIYFVDITKDLGDTWLGWLLVPLKYFCMNVYK